MDHREVGRYWNDNAKAWGQLGRAGYDVYRDYLNTPAFLAMLPDVEGLSGIDIGRGEGHNTRLIADRGARFVGIDIAKSLFVTRPRPSRRSRSGSSIAWRVRSRCLSRMTTSILPLPS